MYKSKNKKTPKICNDTIKKPDNQYPTQFSKENFNVKTFSLQKHKMSISIRKPKTWNEFLTYYLSSLLDTESERKCF